MEFRREDDLHTSQTTLTEYSTTPPRPRPLLLRVFCYYCSVK